MDSRRENETYSFEEKNYNNNKIKEEKYLIATFYKENKFRKQYNYIFRL